MCDHCRSAVARMENRMMGPPVQEKARFAEGTRLEKTVAGAACCAQMGKACCGGGCCESTKLISACCGIKHDETTVKAPRAFDQSQPVQSRNLMHRPGNSLAPATSAPGVRRIECAGFNSGNCPANPINRARENVAPSYDTGVCPAMMNNLPCTSYRDATNREPKCFGGDCCDGNNDAKDASAT